jgi:hypothetical protein
LHKALIYTSTLTLMLLLVLTCTINSSFAQTTKNPKWNYQTIETNNQRCLEISLAIDSSGNPHIAYGNYGGDEKLMYATNSWGHWSIQAIDHTTGALSLALDQDGNPHISYHGKFSNLSDAGLKYASLGGSKWNIKKIDSLGGLSSIVFDSTGNPHIGYITNYGISGYHDGIVNYAYWNGTEWNFQTIERNIEGSYISLVLDSKNNPHLCYFGAWDLEYASWDGAKWNINQVSNSYNLDCPSFALDSHDNPHISYTRYQQEYSSYESIVYASWNGSGWSKQVVTSNLFHCACTSLALDSKDNPHLLYASNDASNEKMKYASWTGSDWSIMTIDDGLPIDIGGPGVLPLVLDSNDNPHVCYKLSNGALIYAYALFNPSITSGGLYLTVTGIVLFLAIIVPFAVYRSKKRKPHILNKQSDT